MSSKWPLVSIGDVCQIRGGGTPSKEVPEFWTGTIPWVSPKDMKSEIVIDSIDHITQEAVSESATSLIPTDSVLMVVRSGILARTVPVAITGSDVAINQDIKALIPSRILAVRFLYYLLLAREEYLLSQVSRGATVHRLMTDQIRGIQFGLPPLAEQQRLVFILDEAFEAIATAKSNTEKNLQNARALFESQREYLLNEFNSEWPQYNLAGLCNLKHGFAFKSEYFTPNSAFTLLTPGNFYESGGYRDRGSKQKFYSGPIPEGFVLATGNLLVAMTEQAAGLLGSPLLVPDTGTYLHNQRLGLVTPKPGVQWENEFFFHVFNLKHVRRAIHDGATGVKVRHTSPAKIGEVVISCPRNTAEQRRIASQLDELNEECQRLEAVFMSKAVALDSLKTSLLHQAFTGNL